MDITSCLKQLRKTKYGFHVLNIRHDRAAITGREDTQQASTMIAPAYCLESVSRRQRGRGNPGEPGSLPALRRSSWGSKAAKFTGRSMRKESYREFHRFAEGPLESSVTLSLTNVCKEAT